MVNAIYKVRSINSGQTDTTCNIGVLYSSAGVNNIFYAGNAGIVKVTVPNGKIRAYFSRVQVGGNDSTTNVSGYLIEQ